MDEKAIRIAAQSLLDEKIDVAEFASRLKSAQESATDEAGTTIDYDRRRRCGFTEVIYGEGKSAKTLADIFEGLITEQQDVLATRVDPEKGAELASKFPNGDYHCDARTFRISVTDQSETLGKVAVVSAGTTDYPVAMEAVETLRWMKVQTDLIQDIGVSGPHRLLNRVEQLRSMDCLVVVAGMEGALPSVVAGHVDVPVFAVPTSVGYGANLGGIAALLSMLNSCAANVAVTNIDAGFKGGYLAGMVARNQAKA